MKTYITTLHNCKITIETENEEKAEELIRFLRMTNE